MESAGQNKGLKMPFVALSSLSISYVSVTRPWHSAKKGVMFDNMYYSEQSRHVQNNLDVLRTRAALRSHLSHGVH